MANFKVAKQADIRPQFCEYIQNKIDVAERNDTIYELTDEDLRIQRLYEDKNLRAEEQVRELSRVLTNDNKEKLIASKRVNFYDVNTGALKDSFIFTEGRHEEPIVTINERGERVALQNRYEYTVDFSPEKVDDFLDQNGVVQLTYFQAPSTAGRTEPTHILVGNVQTFKQATWPELLYGTELKNISSMVNKLPETRAKMNGGIDVTQGVQNVSPLTGQVGYATVHNAELNAIANHQTELGPAQIEALNKEPPQKVERENGRDVIKQEEQPKAQNVEPVANKQEDQLLKVLRQAEDNKDNDAEEPINKQEEKQTAQPKGRKSPSK